MKCIMLLLLLTMPSFAYAYVDPGVLSALYQVLFIVAFGVISALIFRPWAFLKSTFSRMTGRKKNIPDER